MLNELVYSVADVWLIWAFSVFALTRMTWSGIKAIRSNLTRRFLSDERGSSYIFPYMMTFPFYLIFVCWTIQSTMILIVKMGVMHSAHMAARSAIVWRSADPFRNNIELAQEKARQAATIALVPYASGLRGHQKIILLDGVGSQSRFLKSIGPSITYDALFRTMASGTEAGEELSPSDFIRRKYQYAAAMTKSVILREPEGNFFNKPLQVEVSYRMPIHIPGTGYILGRMHISRQFFYRDVRAIATLPLETPESATGKLGIDYDSTLLN